MHVVANVCACVIIKFVSYNVAVNMYMVLYVV